MSMVFIYFIFTHFYMIIFGIKVLLEKNTCWNIVQVGIS